MDVNSLVVAERSDDGHRRASRLLFAMVLATTSLVGCGGDDGPSAADLNGTWVRSNGVTWSIEDGTISVTGGAVDAISFSATGTTIELIDVSCGPARPGTYEWAIADDVMSLMAVTDGCEGRNAALDGASFERTG